MFEAYTHLKMSVFWIPLLMPMLVTSQYIFEFDITEALSEDHAKMSRNL